MKLGKRARAAFRRHLALMSRVSSKRPLLEVLQDASLPSTQPAHLLPESTAPKKAPLTASQRRRAASRLRSKLAAVWAHLSTSGDAANMPACGNRSSRCPRGAKAAQPSPSTARHPSSASGSGCGRDAAQSASRSLLRARRSHRPVLSKTSRKVTRGATGASKKGGSR